MVSELSLNLPDYIETTIVLFKNKVSYPYKGKLLCLDIPISNSFFLKIYYFFIAWLRFKKIVRKENPNHVISFGVPADLISIFTNKHALLRVDSLMSISYSLVYRILIRLFFNKADKIVCVSRVAAKDLADNFGVKKDKIRVIYNPLNVKEIERLVSQSLEPEYEGIFGNPVIITAGRLTRQKNQQFLIRAFEEAKKTIKEARLVILGEGELGPELRQLAKDLDLENSIHFLGWQENPFKFLSKSKVFILSSIWEGLPYAVLEAMACGLPIISADCQSGPREILAPGSNMNWQAEDIEQADYGILTPPPCGKSNSERKLSEAIVKLLSDEQLLSNLSQKSKQRAGDFDIKQIIKQWDFL